MNKVVSRALWGAFFVGGMTVLGAGAAHAADTSGENGAVSGNQVGILGELPVIIGGNAISVLGDSESSGASASPATDATPTPTAPDSSTTTGQDGIASGNQVMPDITLPITIGGNSIGILGDSSTEGTTASAAPNEGTTDPSPAATTTGEEAIAGGNQVMPDITLPITIGGNSISVLGDSSAEGTTASAAGTSDTADTGYTAGTGNAVGATGSSDSSTEGVAMPLMATAAITPAMLLAATGTEARPLIGGILLMLVTGLGMVALKRLALVTG